jgi:hypothetical protein
MARRDIKKSPEVVRKYNIVQFEYVLLWFTGVEELLQKNVLMVKAVDYF